MSTQHRPASVMLQHNKERIAVVDNAVDDDVDTMMKIMMMKIMIIKITMNDDDNDEDDDEYHEDELKNMQEGL